MPFYEIVYETGRMSVAEYANDEEAHVALKNHHDRAVSGQSGGPIGAPAERIAAVYVYGNHPNEFNPAQTMSADVLKKELAGLVDEMKDENGVVAVDLLAMEVRGLSHPMDMSRKGGGFDSFYRTKESKKLKLDFLAA